MGDRTDDFLAKHVADSFKREVDADETVWRSLPFFLALLALAVSALPTVFRGVVRNAHGAWAWPMWIFLGMSAGAFVEAAAYFWQAIKIRVYQYPRRIVVSSTTPMS